MSKATFEQWLYKKYHEEVPKVEHGTFQIFRLLYGRDQKIKRLTADLNALTVAVNTAVGALDKVMKGPSTFQRGRTIAKVTNYLENNAFMFGFKKPVKKSTKSIHFGGDAGTKKHTLNERSAKRRRPGA